jgi:hypothetical protein
MNPVRMEAQVIRDSLLFLSNELDGKLGGPSIPVQDEGSRRRSLYFVHSHNDQQKFLAMFDDAKVQECYRRAASVVPQQALALENSSLAQSAAEKIARRLVPLANGSDHEFIRLAFRVVLCCEPSLDELAACQQTFGDLRRLLQSENRTDGESRCQAQLVQALLNHNDFVTIR